MITLTEVLCLQRDAQYGEFGYHRVLKSKFSNFVTMTSLSDHDAASKTFRTQNIQSFVRSIQLS
jgi:hypothetical protein